MQIKLLSLFWVWFAILPYSSSQFVFLCPFLLFVGLFDSNFIPFWVLHYSLNFLLCFQSNVVKATLSYLILVCYVFYALLHKLNFLCPFLFLLVFFHYNFSFSYYLCCLSYAKLCLLALILVYYLFYALLHNFIIHTHFNFLRFCAYSKLFMPILSFLYKITPLKLSF